MQLDDSYIPKMTLVFVIANVLVFAVLEIMGSTEDATFMAAHGALTAQAVESGKTYVLFTAMFLHFGFLHLVNNMFVLFFIGRYLEQETGSVWFAAIYLVGGLIGNLFSLLGQYHSDGVTVSAGASGAIFAAIGALALLALLRVGRLAAMRRQGVILMVVLAVYQGYTTVGVDNTAHVTGLLGGVLLGALYAFIKKYTRKRV